MQEDGLKEFLPSESSQLSHAQSWSTESHEVGQKISLNILTNIQQNCLEDQIKQQKED